MFLRREAIFRVIARKFFYLGPSGSGAIMKLVVNTLLGIGMQAIAEAVALGEKSGLDRNACSAFFQNCGGRPGTCRQTGESDKERLQPAISLRLIEQGPYADTESRSCGWCADARDTCGLRGQCGTIGPGTGARLFGGDSGDGKQAHLASGDIRRIRVGVASSEKHV